MHTLARRLAILAAVLPLAGATPNAMAQNDAAPDWIRSSERHEALLDIDFAGGSLADYYNGLAPMLLGLHRQMNVIVDPRASAVAMPAFTARSMAAEDALRIPGMLLPGVGVAETGANVVLSADGKPVPVAGTFVVSIDPQNAWTPKIDGGDANPRVTIEFPGGPLSDYLAALRRQAPDVNIVASERAGAARIAPITLRSAPIGAAVQAVDGRLQGGMLRVSQDRIDGQALYAIDLNAPSEQTKVWSLAEHLQAGMNADDLLSGVEAAVGAVGEGGAIRFHAPTAMLIVRGLPDQVDAAGQAVAQMLQVGDRQQDEMRHLRAMVTEAERGMPQLISRMRIAAKEVEVAQVRLQEVREAFEEELAPRSSVAEAELHVVTAEAELERVQSEVARVEAFLADARKRLDE